MLTILRKWWFSPRTETLVRCDSCHRLTATYFYHPDAGNAPLCGVCYNNVVAQEAEDETANI